MAPFTCDSSASAKKWKTPQVPGYDGNPNSEPPAILIVRLTPCLAVPGHVNCLNCALPLLNGIAWPSITMERLFTLSVGRGRRAYLNCSCPVLAEYRACCTALA